MENIGLNELREMFLSFYQSKEHYRRKSFSLIPENDKSLLIINSGMAPLKPYFAGQKTPPAPRMTTCQKCIRTGDIDNVGHTARHGTFFEMMGSFSFGDYFKLDSITWGWEFITNYLKLPEEKIWATVYQDDQEAYDIWKNVIHMPEERIVRLGKDDNFWEIGTGPCGPCSEIYYDRGPEYGCGSPDCKPGCECDRYLEFWNHVFTQFSRDDAGNYSELEHKNIDTGLGLERLACIMQGVDSIYRVDTIKYILDGVCELAGIEYEFGHGPKDIPIRIVTDHIRSVVFMIADGIIPSNEGRGYVLRRILRRAARQGKILGIQGAFLTDLSERVIETSGGAYPELVERREYIRKIISVEEEKFASTIDQGTSILAEYVDELKKSNQTVLSGEKVFKLYDTYGFPMELTEEILEENGCTADMDGFRVNMEKQKELARAGRKADDDEGWKETAMDFAVAGSTEFTGYDSLTGTGRVTAVFENKTVLDEIGEGDTARVILEQTPFYAEMGGQSWDCGRMYNAHFEADVLEVVKFQNNFAHKVVVRKGSLKPGDTVTCVVDAARRNNTARNHTATHLLQKALQQVLGDHVQQAGSSVTPEALRFDFTHFEAVSAADLQKIEDIVNQSIIAFMPVSTDVMSIEDAKKSGAMALFGEKYGNSVRVVSVGDFSRELCGGTHVANSGQIGSFRIVSEAGVAAGVRRIEAITGLNVYKQAAELEAVVTSIAGILKANPAAVLQKASNLTEEVKTLRKEIEELKKASMGGASELLAGAQEIGGVKLVTKAFADVSINELREMSDEVKKTAGGVVLVLASENGGKVTFLVSVTDDLLDKGYHAGNMIKKIAAACGGGGGGKADMAQAGAKDPSRIPEAFEVAKSLIG